MSIKLNEKQLIGVHLLASGFKASVIAKQLSIREETLSRWRQIDEFKDALEDATEAVLREIHETHKNLLILSQSVINEALNNEELDLFKKANLALRFLSLIKGKDDITQKSSHNLFRYTELGNF
jgi:cytochrome b